MVCCEKKTKDVGEEVWSTPQQCKFKMSLDAVFPSPVFCISLWVGLIDERVFFLNDRKKTSLSCFNQNKKVRKLRKKKYLVKEVVLRILESIKCIYKDKIEK